METLKNYLENMFSRLPNTPEVQKAKYELAQMMEDKYSELKSEGKSENEAIGIVISEFGNLDELAETLGIKSFMNPQNEAPSAKTFPAAEAFAYLKANSRRAWFIALGVMLCIVSPTAVIISDCARGNSDFADAIGVSFFFLLIAVAVGLFVMSGFVLGRWNYLKKESFCLDFETSQKLHEQNENYRTTHALLLTVGIAFCIMSVVPPIVLDSIRYAPDYVDNLEGISVLFFVAVGVFMIVLTCNKKSGYTSLLHLNGSATVGGNFVPSQKESVHYDNPTVAAVMSVFWPTVTCIYLCVSFLTFDWFVTWLIWPIASIINALVKSTLGRKY